MGVCVCVYIRIYIYIYMYIDGNGKGNAELFLCVGGKRGFFRRKILSVYAAAAAAERCCARPSGERVESTLIKVSRVSGY